MPELSNPQFESFARNRAAGFSRTEAAKRSEYAESTAHNTGSRLDKRPEISARIKELCAATEPNGQVVPREWIESEAVLLHKRAKKTPATFAVSKACLELLARMNGYLDLNARPKKHEHLHWHALDSKALNQLWRREVGSLPAEDRAALLLEAPIELRNAIEVAVESSTSDEEKAIPDIMPVIGSAQLAEGPE